MLRRKAAFQTFHGLTSVFCFSHRRYWRYGYIRGPADCAVDGAHWPTSVKCACADDCFYVRVECQYLPTCENVFTDVAFTDMKYHIVIKA